MRTLGILVLAACLLSGCRGAPAQAVSDDTTTLGDTSVVVRRIASGSLNPYAMLPGGQAVIVSDTFGNLAVRDLAGDNGRVLTSDGDWTNRWPESAVASPDGASIAYAWWNDDRIELRVVPTAGGASRVLYSVGTRDGELHLYDWRPDGQALLVLLQPSGTAMQLAEISLADGLIEPLHTYSPYVPNGPRYAPDGRSLMYSLQRNDELRSRDLYLLPLGGEPRLVVDMPDAVSPVGWAADGATLLFTTTQDGIIRLWKQPMRGVESAGEPQLVRGDLVAFHSLGTDNGRAYFHTIGRQVQLHHVMLSPTTLAPTSPPSVFADIDDAFALRIVWSPDGEHVAYTLSPYGESEPRHVVIRSRAGGQERRFAREPRLGNGIEWRADGLLLTSEDGALRLDFNAGRFVPAEPTPTLTSFGLGSTSADGTWSALVRRVESVERLVVRDERNDSERVLLETPRVGTRRISPDGRWVARLAGNDGRVILHPTDGSPARELFVPPSGSRTKGGSIAWAPDSRHVLFLMQHVQGDSATSEFWKVDLDGTASHVMTAGGPGGAIVFGLSPDGRQLVFSSGNDARESELWVVEGI